MAGTPGLEPVVAMVDLQDAHTRLAATTAALWTLNRRIERLEADIRRLCEQVIDLGGKPVVKL